MDFNKFMIEWANADVEQHGLDDFIDMLAECVPCECCPLRLKCDYQDCKATLYKEIGAE